MRKLDAQVPSDRRPAPLASDPQTARQRIAAQVASLNPESEREALPWIEVVSEFDNPTTDFAD
jgi:hypothetical protein